jgi:GT2 family glycosyltransferase
MSQRPQIDVSVIIVTYNSREVVATAIDSILTHTSGVSFEIIVVDNASPDDTGAFVSERYRQTAIADGILRVLHLPKNAGLSAALNHGVAASSGTFIMQLNPDCRLDAEPSTDSNPPTDPAHDPLSVLAVFLREHEDVGIAAPQLLNDDGTLQLSCRAFPGYSTALFSRYSLLTKLWPNNPVSRRYLMTGFDHTEQHDVDWVSGAALMFPRATFDRLGGWDPNFFLFSEDVDFCKRAHNATLRVVYLPAARVYHTIGISKHPSRRAIIERHKSMYRYYRKHLRRVWLQDFVTAPVIAVRCALALLGATTKRRSGP